MKKLYTTPEYKRMHKHKLEKLMREKRRRIKRRGRKRHVSNPQNRIYNHINDLKPKIEAPTDFRLLENTEECLRFFRNIRSIDFISRVKNIRFVEMSLENVKQIDYSTISILTAISDDLKFRNIFLRGNFPEDEHCKEFLENSGFLNQMFDEKGRRFPKSEKSEMLFFEKGSQRFTRDDNIRISVVVKNIMKHLTGEDGYYQPLRTILLEICGNSIEWSGTENKQWLLGVKYEDHKAIITVTDVGKGILKTLYRKHGRRFSDFVTLQTSEKILMGAFEKKYGSKSQKINRNKGLPSIRNKFKEGSIKELKVLTNNVILHFDKQELSSTINHGAPWFKGTFYRWVVTKDCIKK